MQTPMQQDTPLIQDIYHVDTGGRP